MIVGGFPPEGRAATTGGGSDSANSCRRCDSSRLRASRSPSSSARRASASLIRRRTRAVSQGVFVVCLRFLEGFPFNVLERSPVARRIPCLPAKRRMSLQPPRCLRIRWEEKLGAKITRLQPIGVLPLRRCQPEHGLEHGPGCLPELARVRLYHMAKGGVKLLPNRTVIDPSPSVRPVGVQRVVECAGKGHEQGPHADRTPLRPRHSRKVGGIEQVPGRSSFQKRA